MSSSDPQGIGAWSATVGAASGATTDVRAAIARAAQSSGVDFSYLMAQARLESGLNPNARAATSSATGLYQFTNSTWADTLARHGDALGLGNGSGGVMAALSDPAARARLMALRNDPQASAMMAAQLAGDNQAMLTASLGHTPDASELYLAHFLGADGASKFLSALATDPGQSAASLLPKAAAANRAIFFDASGAPRSLGDVKALLDARLATAMQTAPTDAANVGLYGQAAWIPPSNDVAAATPAGGGPLAQEFAQAQAQVTQGGSMADTLQNMFAMAGDATGTGPASDLVRSAYGRMQALGL